MVIDICGFGQWHNRAQLQVRDTLNKIMRTAFHSAGLAWSRLAIEDRGDGMIILIPAEICKVDLLDPVIPSIVDMIHLNNSTAAAPRIRLRIAVHAGEVHRDGFGWVGSDLNLTCRLVNDQTLRWRLLDTPRADLVLVVSDVVYQGVVRHGYRGISPATYAPVHVRVKEVSTRAWVHLP